jgi:hypothetical protein
MQVIVKLIEGRPVEWLDIASNEEAGILVSQEILTMREQGHWGSVAAIPMTAFQSVTQDGIILP